MRHSLSSALFILALGFAPVLPAYAAPPQGAPPSSGFADLAESLLPAVVNISSTQKMTPPENMPEVPHFPPGSPFEDFFEEFMKRQGDVAPDMAPSSLGSGFIIDAEKGYIVTNNHVVKDAEDVQVTLHDDTTVHAEIIGRDEKMDLAVLKIDPKKEKLKAVSFGNSDILRVGDWILAIGNPFGLGGTVTAGIVSARARDINAGPYDDFIQTDASINRGNSGGPMFDMKGEVIGINTAIYSPSGGSVGIGFAIPANMARPVIKQLIEFGRTRRGWLGVRIQTVTDEIAESFGLDKAKGALVSSVTAGGPAEKAGLQAGDVILAFDGKPVTDMRSLPRMVAETPIGEKADVSYWRDGKTMKASVEVGELEKAEKDGLVASADDSSADDNAVPDGTVVESVGLTLGKLSDQDRDQYVIPADVKGVLVSGVESGSEAAKKGLAVGDVVVEINQESVDDPKTAADMIAQAVKDGRNSVLLLINRENDVRFVALKLKK